MQSVSTKEAARNIHRLLDAAEDGPVMIMRHGRKRAAIMCANDFDIVLRILDRERDRLAAGFL